MQTCIDETRRHFSQNIFIYEQKKNREGQENKKISYDNKT